jgi:hypothetical protein
LRASADDVLEYHRKTVNKSEEALADDGGAAVVLCWLVLFPVPKKQKRTKARKVSSGRKR